MDSICEMPYTMMAFTCGNFLGFGVLRVGLITPEFSKIDVKMLRIEQNKVMEYQLTRSSVHNPD